MSALHAHGRLSFIEPRGVVNTGEYGSDLKAKNNVWI
ncbi:MAG: hypothetical protein ACI8PB_003060 [Desulforhopalus sp.]|jgi:hypothetical protein